MSTTYTLSGAKINKLAAHTGVTASTNWAEIEFLIPVAEETDVLSMVTGGIVNSATWSVEWNTANGTSDFVVTFTSVRKGVIPGGSTLGYYVSAMTAQNPSATIWGYIGLLLDDFAKQTAKTLTVVKP